MDVLITGGSGFLGRALSYALQQENGARVTWLTRRHTAAPAGIRQMLYRDLPSCRENFDVVVNLAGAGIADKRWTSKRKAELLASRLQPTQAVLDWLENAPRKPKLLLSGSAIGWYGAQDAETVLTEQSAAYDDFPHQLCAQWEAVAFQAAASGVPVTVLRTGLVLDAAGGMLRKMVLPFRLCCGCTLGSGRQILSWISRRDWVRAVQFVLQQDENQRKPVYNLTAPQPVSNAELTAALGAWLRRPVFLNAPEAVLKILLGEMATLLVDGQYVVPQALLEAGFVFEDAEIGQALRSHVPQC